MSVQTVWYRLRHTPGGRRVFFLLAFVLVLVAGGIGVYGITRINGIDSASSAASTERTVIYSPNSVANQTGNSVQTAQSGTEVWIGSGSQTDVSYLGIRTNGRVIPANATIVQAELRLTSSKDQWIAIDTVIGADAASSPKVFNNANRPSARTLTSASVIYNENTQWLANQVYTVDVTSLIQEVVSTNKTRSISAFALVVRGNSLGFGRKYITNARIVITYRRSGTAPTVTASPTPTTIPTATPSGTPTTPPAGSGSNSHAIGLWSPNPKYDTCTKAFHDNQRVRGPDGKWYPTWHPPVGTLSNGQTCTFGHEHGRDPATSALYGWIKEHYAFDANGNGKADAEELAVSGLPFGYANEQLDAQNASKGIATGSRHEDHVGHKIEWEDNLQLKKSNLASSGNSNSPTSLSVRCNFLMKVHQGTHSRDAFSNNLHELQYFVQCDDGTRLGATKMVPFGVAGQVVAACDKTTKYTVSPVVPANSPNGGGVRFIPTRACAEQYFLVPNGQFSDIGKGLYEDWVSSNYLNLPNGTTLAYFDPHFAVFTPSRFYDPTKPDLTGRSIDLCYEREANGDRAKNGECEEATNYGQIKGIAYDSPQSPFNGVHREFYFNQTWIKNTGGPLYWYTDPMGGNASRTAFTGSIRQYVAQMDNYNKVILESQALGKDRYYGGQGVHAPN